MKKKRCLLATTGALILLGLSVSGCSARQTMASVETTVVDAPLELDDPTTEVVETIEDGGEIGVTANGETVYSFGKYGELGKTVFDNLASSWVHWKIADEAALRQVMDATYGDLSTKEELTQEILAMERDAQTNPAPAETKDETPATKPSETTAIKPSTKETTAPSKNNNSTPETKSQEQATVQEQPSGLTPEQKAEQQRRIDEQIANQPKSENGEVRIDPTQDFNSGAGQWDWD